MRSKYLHIYSLLLAKAPSPDFDYMARNVYVANIIKFYSVLLIRLAEMKTRLCCGEPAFLYSQIPRITETQPTNQRLCEFINFGCELNRFCERLRMRTIFKLKMSMEKICRTSFQSNNNKKTIDSYAAHQCICTFWAYFIQ